MKSIALLNTDNILIYLLGSVHLLWKLDTLCNELLVFHIQTVPVVGWFRRLFGSGLSVLTGRGALGFVS